MCSILSSCVGKIDLSPAKHPRFVSIYPSIRISNHLQIGFAKMLLHYAKFSKDERPAMYARVKKEFGDVVCEIQWDAGQSVYV